MSAPATTANGQIIKRPPAANGVGPAVQRSTLAAMIQTPEMLAEIKRALPAHVTADRMARIVLTALRVNPKLMECTPESFFGCVLQASQLGLEPNTPLQHCYLIPRKKKFKDGDGRWREKMECTLLIGYQGEIDLSLRSGKVRNVFACVVREGDTFEYERGLSEKLRHVPSPDPDREDKPITHVYTIARTTDGQAIWDVLTIRQVEKRRARSMASEDGPWVTDFEAMVQKTGVRALWKWLPKSSEVARVAALEAAADTGRGLLAAFDPGVTDALSRTGIAPIEHDEDGVVIESQEAPAAEGATPEPAAS